MPSVSFSHIKTREKEYLIDLLAEKKWFERRKFPVFLPKNKADIEQEIWGEDKSLKHKIARLQKAWREIEKDYFKTVKRFGHRKLLSSYKCHVSRFGPEGKYCHPNLFFVRLRTRRDNKRANATIGHELLHLLFTDFFEFKKLNYAEREGMVDALLLETDLTRLFPKYERQSIGKVRRRLLESILSYGR